MLFICTKCGAVAGCKLAASLHVVTTHFHQEVWVPPYSCSEETGKNCIGCLLENTIPVEEYWKRLGIDLSRGTEQ